VKKEEKPWEQVVLKSTPCPVKRRWCAKPKGHAPRGAVGIFSSKMEEKKRKNHYQEEKGPNHEQQGTKIKRKKKKETKAKRAPGPVKLGRFQPPKCVEIKKKKKK